VSVVLTLRYHDSEPGGGIHADDAEAKREAAKVAREVLDDLADEDDLDTAICAAMSARDAAGGLDSDERERMLSGDVTTQDLDDDEALDIAAELMQFEWDTLPGDPPGLDPVALRQALETALTGVAGLLANWERGDLAGQVHALQGWAEGTFEKFPDLDAERWIAAGDLRPGDLVDMQGVYAEDTMDGNCAEFEYCRVIDYERERPDLVRVDFSESASFGFDPDRFVKAVCTAKARAEWAQAEADAQG
jgi:hypothetical protein